MRNIAAHSTLRGEGIVPEPCPLVCCPVSGSLLPDLHKRTDRQGAQHNKGCPLIVMMCVPGVPPWLVRTLPPSWTIHTPLSHRVTFCYCFLSFLYIGIGYKVRVDYLLNLPKNVLFPAGQDRPGLVFILGQVFLVYTLSFKGIFPRTFHLLR